MTIIKQFESALHAAHVHALRDALTSKATAAQLRELITDYPALGELTLAELFDSGAPKKARARKAPKSSQPAGFDARTPAGRAALERAVLGALADLGGENIAAEEIRKRSGATAAQIRTTLNRAIEAGTVTYTGQARGTRYSLA